MGVKGVRFEQAADTVWHDEAYRRRIPPLRQKH
jgi:hypothetical protein